MFKKTLCYYILEGISKPHTSSPHNASGRCCCKRVAQCPSFVRSSCCATPSSRTATLVREIPRFPGLSAGGWRSLWVCHGIYGMLRKWQQQLMERYGKMKADGFDAGTTHDQYRPIPLLRVRPNPRKALKMFWWFHALCIHHNNIEAVEAVSNRSNFAQDPLSSLGQPISSDLRSPQEALSGVRKCEQHDC